MLPKPNFLQNANSGTNCNRQFQRPNEKSPINFNLRENKPCFHNKTTFNKTDSNLNKINYSNNYNVNNYSNNKDLIKCNHKGCTFTGAKDVVFMHKKIQHFELQNKYNPSSKLETPEDIEQWKAERRARFPTVENDKKQLESTGQSNVNRQNKKTNNYREKRKLNRKFNNDNFGNKRNKFDRILSTKQTNDNLSTSSPNKCFPVVDKTNSSSLSNLLSCYGSDEEEGEIIDSKPDNSSATIQQDTIEHEDEIKQLVNDLIVKLEYSSIKESSNRFKKNSACKSKSKLPKPTLLCRSKLNLFQKLLLQDVDNSKNDLVECLQILVDSNFLQNSI